MLRLIGSHYHFRRAVPVAVQARLSRTEISLSLQTQSKLVARERAAALYARTGALFEKAKTMATDLSREEMIALLTEQSKIIAEQEELLTLADDAFRAEKRALQADHAMTMMDQVQKEGAFISFATDSLKALETRLQAMMQKVFTDRAVSKKEKDMLREQIEILSALIVDMGRHRPAVPGGGDNENPAGDAEAKARKPTSPPLSVMAEKFVFADMDKSEDTRKATRKTVTLFIEAFGDIPVKQITGAVAGKFFDLLSDLPATHGKGRSGLPIREAVVQARERGQETVSGKTVKNHFSRLSALWMHLVQRDMADRNPWAGWNFDITKKIVRRGWTDDEMTRLAHSPWKGTSVSRRSWAGIISGACSQGCVWARSAISGVRTSKLSTEFPASMSARIRKTAGHPRRQRANGSSPFTRTCSSCRGSTCSVIPESTTCSLTSRSHLRVSVVTTLRGPSRSTRSGSASPRM
jgi:hypothetical protein